MTSFAKTKKSFAGFKGHYTRSLKAYNALIDVKPFPTLSSMEAAYDRLRKRMDILFNETESMIAFLEEGKFEDGEEVDIENEIDTVNQFFDRLISEQTEVETSYAIFKEKYAKHNSINREPMFPSVPVDRATVKLTALAPPTWNGIKADFYTWKRKFEHIMHEAKVSDELIQLCYVQNSKTLPAEYQSYISDCSNISEVWSRLEERVPKETIKYEVIAQFRRMKPLSSKNSPSVLRDFANEISLFSRRMLDLGITKESYSCIIMQDIYERLDHDTTRRYRGKIELKKELGVVAQEDLDSLCDFIRSEATTLELSARPSQQYSEKPPILKKVNFLETTPVDETSVNMVNKMKCILGCEAVHRLIDCENYMKFTVEQRREFIKKASRCFACLGINHTSRMCTKKDSWKCKNCFENFHHRTLCKKESSYENKNTSLNPTAESFPVDNKVNNVTINLPNQHTSDESECAIVTKLKPKDYSPLVLVEVKTSDGTWMKARCFLDTGSNSSLVRSDFAKSSGLTGRGACNIQFGIAGGGIHQEKGEEFEICVRPVDGDKEYLILATGIQRPCYNVLPLTADIISMHTHLEEVREKLYIAGGEVDILVGLDYAPLIIPERIERATSHPDDNPSVAYTRLGCYMYGALNKCLNGARNDVLAIHYVSKLEEEEWRSFFYGDIIGVKPTSRCVCSEEEILESSFIKHVRETTHINEEGRVYVKLPWKPGFPDKLPNNFQAAKNQMLRRERQLIQNGKLEIYNKEIEDLVDRKVVKILTEEEASKSEVEAGWYLNHRIIEKPDKETTKLRLVFDSAAKFSGVCLNDGLEKGPNYTNSLFRCFLKWRMEEVAVCGDMSKMFNQIVVDENDQQYHRFLWRNGDLSLPVSVYQWSRVLFGDKSSPDLASFAIRFLAGKYECDFPVGAGILKDNTYVDDVGYSATNDDVANQSKSEIDEILKGGMFTIKTWNSNSSRVDQNPNQSEVDYLGHCWNKKNDQISIKMKDPCSYLCSGLTKRIIMSTVAKLWDPFGYLLPVTIKYRIDLQRIWQKEYDWDELLPTDMVQCWTENIHQMQSLVEVIVDRCLKPKNVVGLPQLHSFSDGGDHAYGTCVYIRWRTSDRVKIVFVAAKAFVAPLKRKTVPRLELMGAVAMSRLVTEIEASLNYQFEYKRFWIDSEVVIYWLHSGSCHYKPFVSSRIQEFEDSHPNWREEVRYIPSLENPADCLTKHISIEELGAWHEGEPCTFLRLPEECWPEKMDMDHIDAQRLKPVLEEKVAPPDGNKRRRKLKSNISTCNLKEGRVLPLQSFNDARVTLKNEDLGYYIAEQFSSWTQLLRGVSTMKQIFKLHTFSREQLSHTPESIQTAEMVLYQMCQKHLKINMDETRKRFVKLNPTFDENGVIRGKGRLEKTNLPENTKYPIILPSEHPIVYLFAQFHHKRLLHQGYRVVIANLINIGIIIGGGKGLLKSIASKCLFCRIRRRKLLQQQMGVLPSFRIQERKAPFASVAIDFFGNLKIKVTRNSSINGSAMIVVCMTTRCVHLELCSTIDTNSFLQAWRRFTTSRGVHPNHVFSDGGAAFKGAHKPISNWIMNWNHRVIEAAFHLTSFEFDWKFNVPTASHMNGVVESLINSVRKGLDAAVTNYTRNVLSYEDWSTVLSEITYVVNSRPLFPEGDPWDFHCITGNDILHPYGHPSVPQFDEEVGSLRKMFQVVQNKVDMFWNTWLKHIPPQLNSRNKWFHPRENLEIGDYVIMLEPGMKGNTSPRSLWKKAIVTEVHPGEDGLVRIVTVKDSKRNEYRRPIHKLCLIATRKELEQGN